MEERMFIDDAPKKPKPEQLFPRDISEASVGTMQEYLVALEEEIARVQREIDSRGGAKTKAEALFKR
jgi:uncharacterized small protein (DUF1192 family)